MRVAIVGGCGFLGKNTSTLLRENGHQVLSIHRNPHLGARDSLDCLYLDFRESDSMVNALNNVDVLIHFGHNATPQESDIESEKYVSENLTPSLMLFDLAISLSINKIIFATAGGAMYGKVNKLVKVNENHLPQPSSSYSNSKLFLENYLRYKTHNTSTKSISLRLGNAYGPGQEGSNSFGVVPNFISNIEKGTPCRVFSMESTRDFVYIEDVSTAVLEALRYEGPHEVFNIGSGVGTSIEALISSISKTVGRVATIERVPEPSNFILHNILDSNLAAKEFGWSATVDVAQGIILIIKDINEKEKMQCL